MDTYKNFIGGRWLESASSKIVNNINPANTDDIIGTNRQATRAEARAAVEAAAEAFAGWRRTPAPQRGKIVAKAARLMEEAKEELATIVSAPVLSEIPPLTTAVEEGQQLRAEWMQRGALSVMAVLIAAGFATTYLFG